MITNTEYNGSIQTLFTWPWIDVKYAAFRLNANYNFSRTHTTYADIKPHVLGGSAELKSKQIVVDSDITKLVCDAIQFTGDFIDAYSVVVVAQPDGSAKDTDPLLCYLNLDNKKAVNINKAISIVDCGLIAIKRPSNA